MKLFGRSFFITLLFVSCSAHAASNSYTITPGIDYGYKKNGFKFNTPFFSEALDIDPTITTFSPSLAVSYGPFYGVANYETTISEWKDEYYTFNPAVPRFDFYSTSFSRQESTFTVGYSVLESLSLFAGYLNGSSEYRYLQLYESATTSGARNGAYDFEEKGYYLGASYSLSVGNKGTLNMSAAAGKMRGLMNFQGLEVDPADFDFFSDANGYSLGLQWVGPVTGNLAYRVGLKYNSYHFDVDKVVEFNQILHPEFNGLKIEEDILSFYFGIMNYF